MDAVLLAAALAHRPSKSGALNMLPTLTRVRAAALPVLLAETMNGLPSALSDPCSCGMHTPLFPMQQLFCNDTSEHCFFVRRPVHCFFVHSPVQCFFVHSPALLQELPTASLHCFSAACGMQGGWTRSHLGSRGERRCGQLRSLGRSLCAWTQAAPCMGPGRSWPRRLCSNACVARTPRTASALCTRSGALHSSCCAAVHLFAATGQVGGASCALGCA